MLTPQHKKEAFSRAYVRALATLAGVNISHSDFDYGLDLGIAEIKRRDEAGGSRYITGVEFRAQLKCSHDITLVNNEVVYDLEAKTYNDLVDNEINIPRILILIHVSEDETDWINLTAEELVLKKCAYWHFIQGAAPTVNTATIRIKIPVAQIFNGQTILDIITNIKAGNRIL